MPNNIETEVKKNKKRIKFTLIVNGKVYKNTGCSRDITTGIRYCTFERRNGFTPDRIKVSKKEIDVNYETGECTLIKS